MSFSSVRLEGSILSADLLDAVAREDKHSQKAQDFGLPPTDKVKDEIATTWATAKTLWVAYQHRLESLKGRGTGTTETRNLFISPLLTLLGYKPDLSEAETIQGKSYAISHRDPARDAMPIHVIGPFHPNAEDDPNRSTLDVRLKGVSRMSPHALVQEYLNLTEHLYAIVTNGRQLRLLRDSSRLIKLSFLEFDFERIFGEDLFADFALLYRVLHASRMPTDRDSAAESIIERYHQDSLDSGSRIREGLAAAVERSILDLANGFLTHEDNHALREAAATNTFPTGPQEAERTFSGPFYQSLLRLIYRLLFLLVTEERGLIQSRKTDARKIRIYRDFYSLRRLRGLADSVRFHEKRHTDAWQSLLRCFSLFAPGDRGVSLDIKPLGGLFNADVLGLLEQCQLDNYTLLRCLRNLSLFQHPDTKQWMRVNYAALNVEEFGSVYEGLLEYDPAVTEIALGQWQFSFVMGEDRASSGSHYTPDELVQPLIKHSLDYLIADRLKDPDPVKALLSLTVCDVACGSGHILLSAARRIGTEIAILRTGEEQPSPSSMREAVRDVIRHCIYGVDLNPLAVELCKVALWLEAHSPGEPLNFLDHHIKCGNAIVGFVGQEELEKGVPMEAFKTLPGDDKEVAAALRKRNKEGHSDDKRQVKMKLSSENQRKLDEIRQRWQMVSGLPETNPHEIEHKRELFRKFSTSEDAYLLQQIAAIPIAQFYQPKTLENKSCVITEQDYREYLTGQRTPQGQATASAWAIAHRKKFFHWFLEFPEIIQNGGFDCILGNPSYQGGQALSGNYGHAFCEYVRWQYTPTGLSDLVVFFLRRIHKLLKARGFTAFITTNSIKDGDVRKDGLDQVMAGGASINFAVRGIKWPGQANLVVSLVGIHRAAWKGPFELDGRPVKMISSFFEDSENLGDPEKLTENAETVFQGSIFLGDGFLMSHEEANALRRRNPKNEKVLFPIINGQELNNQPDQNPGRSIINFFDWPMEQAQKFGEPFAIVEEKVRPVRMENKREVYRRKWWLYAEPRPKLYLNMRLLSRCFVAAATTKYLNFSETPTGRVFANTIYVFTTDRWDLYTTVQSTVHEVWARKYSGALETRLRYSPSDCFSTFAFPKGLWEDADTGLAERGECYHDHRKATMRLLWLGLTKIYNLFHDPELTPERVEKVSGKPADIAQQGYEALLKLRELHVEMDVAVRDAYGWTDLHLEHGFHDLDYLPENDRTRYTISPAARKEVLHRLLKLNHERAAEEKAAGLHDKKSKRAKKRRGVRTPASNVDELNLGLDLFGNLDPAQTIPVNDWRDSVFRLPTGPRHAELSVHTYARLWVHAVFTLQSEGQTGLELFSAYRLLCTGDSRKIVADSGDEDGRSWARAFDQTVNVEDLFSCLVSLAQNREIERCSVNGKSMLRAASGWGESPSEWVRADAEITQRALFDKELRDQLLPFTETTPAIANYVKGFEEALA